jgi:signal transduction histidine kinase
LTDTSESGSARGGSVAYPLLLECDSRGQVLWMSERTRATLGELRLLVDTIATKAFSQGYAGKPPVLAVRFTRILESGDKVWLHAQLDSSAESAAQDDASEWLNLQERLLRHFLRLELAERNLSSRAKLIRHGGRTAIRQVEMERQRLGLELHTGVGQMLAAIHLQLEVISGQLPTLPLGVRQAMDRISTLAGESLEQVRSIARRLHPPEWQRLTLEAALQQLWDISGIPQRFEATLRVEPLPREPDLEVKVIFYRAAQEALSNLERHSRATRVNAALEIREDRLVLTIEDNGVGFDVPALLSAPASVASGIGLRSIREQTAALGGKVEIRSGSVGTTLVVSAPLSPAKS